MYFFERFIFQVRSNEIAHTHINVAKVIYFTIMIKYHDLGNLSNLWFED